MIRRPPRSTLDRSSAASDVYKRQARQTGVSNLPGCVHESVHRLPRTRLALGAIADRLQMTFVAHHPTKRDAVRLSRLPGERHDRFTRLYATAPLSDVEIHQHTHLRACRTRRTGQRIK